MSNLLSRGPRASTINGPAERKARPTTGINTANVKSTQRKPQLRQPPTDSVRTSDRVWMDVLHTEENPEQKAEQTFRRELSQLINGLPANVIILVLILSDAALFALKTFGIELHEYFSLLSILLLGIFVLEQFLRIVVDTCIFLKSPSEILDFVLVMASMVLILDERLGHIIIPTTVAAYVTDLMVLIIQITRIAVRLIARSRMFCAVSRQLVGGNKQRYQKDGFDLDLTFITKRIIAMGLPSTSIEGMYRNPIDEVVRFFKKMYGENYMIINLCSERTYPANKFNNRVVRFPFDDHNPPPLPVMLRFCMFVDSYLKESADNVVAIHCKGGKGRTGTMICAWLLYSRCDLYSEQVLKLFAHQRTDQQISGAVQGVAGPSQIRYVNYFEKLRLEGLVGEVDILNLAALETDNDAKSQQISLAACKRKVEHAPRCELVSLRMNHVVSKKSSLLQDDAIGSLKPGNWSLIITHYPSGTLVQHDGEFSPDEGGKRYEYSAPNDYVYRASEAPEGQRESGTVYMDIKSWQKESSSVILSGDMRFQIFNKNKDSKDHVDEEAPAEVGNSQLFCSFWLHTSFMTPNGCHMVLQKSAVDEVHKNDNLHDEFNIDLEYILPAKGDLITEDDHKTHHHANHGAKKKLKKFGSMKKPKSMRKKKRTGNKTMPTTPRHSSARDLTIEMDDLMFSDVPTVEMASQSNSATPQQLQSPTSKPQESLDFDLFS